MAARLTPWLVHSASVETYSHAGTRGPRFAAAVTVPCFVEQKRHLVVNGDGQEVTAETLLFAEASYSATFAPRSRVTFGGRTSTVIAVATFTSGTLSLPDHVEVSLS